MPTYRFLCEKCGLSFTAQGKPDVKEIKCECGEKAKRALPQGVNITVSGGNVDTRTDATGLSGIDYDWDRAIGESSRKTWRKLHQRQMDKIEVVRANNVTGWDLSRNPDGTYRVMAPEERAASERSREFHFKMTGHARRQGVKI
jgi:putative FmdB family regulatory protein